MDFLKNRFRNFSFSGLIVQMNRLKCSNYFICYIINTTPKSLLLFTIYSQAGKNFYPGVLNMSHLMGVLPRNKLHPMDILSMKSVDRYYDLLPEKYDVSLKWSACQSVVLIRDQSNCGSCWVYFILFLYFIFYWTVNKGTNFYQV